MKATGITGWYSAGKGYESDAIDRLFLCTRRPYSSLIYNITRAEQVTVGLSWAVDSTGFATRLAQEMGVSTADVRVLATRSDSSSDNHRTRANIQVEASEITVCARVDYVKYS